MKSIIFILLFLFLFLSNGIAQKVERYEGPFINGLKEPATASYSYYLDKNAKKIKHGNFRYTVKVREADYRFSQNFNGPYQHGLKNGKWEYSINIKDYKSSGSSEFFSYEIIMIANYTNGIPDGEWQFKSLISKRNKYKKGAEDKWTEATVIKDISIHTTFKNGMLVDSLEIIDKLGDSFLFIADENGLLNGLSTKTNREGIVFWTNYEMGFEKNSGISDSVNVENAEYKLFVGAKNNTINYLKIDTVSKFDASDFSVQKLLAENLYNDEYFILKYVDGDKFVTFDPNGYTYKVRFSGLKYLKLRNTLNPAEQNYLTQIQRVAYLISDKIHFAEIKLKKDPKNAELEKDLNQLKSYKSTIEKYNCISSYIANETSLESALAKSNKQCGDAGIPTKGIKREIYLQKLSAKAKEIDLLVKSIKI